MQIQRLVLIHPFLLHYHFARLQALSDACHEAGVSMCSLELASYSDQYRALVAGQERRFDNRVLFSGRGLESLSTREMWRSVKAALIALRPDVVFIYGYSLRIMRRVAFWAWRNRIGVVMIGDSNEFDRPRYKPLQWLKSLFISRLDAAFVGGTSSGQYVQTLGLPAERVVPGYDVIDVEKFARRAQESKHVQRQLRDKWRLPDDFFLCIGRIIREKNLERLIEAYGEYARLIGGAAEPWGLSICGSGPDEENLRRAVEGLPQGLRGRVQLHGLVTQAEIVDFYSCASCFVLPSTYESWGLVVNEAMACELPVLISRRAGCAADLVKPGATGWLFDPYDVDELARAMTTMHRLDSSARLEMGKEGRRLIADWDLQRFCQGALESAEIAYRRQRCEHEGAVRLAGG